DDQPDTEHRQLLLLKRAMITISLEMNKDGRTAAATAPAYRLGCAIRCLRAVEDGRWIAVQRPIDDYPGLLHGAQIQAAFAWGGPLSKSCATGLQLAREDIRQDLHDLSWVSAQLPAEAMAGELARHWSEVFAAGNVDADKLESWLQECSADGPAACRYGKSLALWQLTSSSTLRALWIPTAIADLRAAYADEPGGAGTGDHTFNLGILCCMPKKPVEQRPELGDVYTAESTRPLSLVDVSNRLIAAACKQRWESPLGQCVSQAQRGFLPGRSMLANVTELERHAMLTALSKPEGIMVLVDFRAAFPSVSRGFLRRCLEGLGMPDGALRVLDALYDSGQCAVSRWPGFALRSGIRQGCPLSPLIFAAAMDLLLRVLSRRPGPEVLIRAFADDVGIVLADMRRQLPILQQALSEFGDLSGMVANLPETVGIPLWEDTLDAASAVVSEACPAWAGLPLKRAAVDLGCAVGRGRAGQIWHTAVKRFRERVEGWTWSEMGLHFATVPCDTYALPVLPFIAQAALPSQEALLAEAWATRRAAPGPGFWCVQSDLWPLREHFDMPCSFGSLEVVARAAQMRVFFCENSAHGGLQLDGKALQPRTARGATSYLIRGAAWAGRFDSAMPQVLLGTVAQLATSGVTVDHVGRLVATGGRRFQAAARGPIEQTQRTPPRIRIRHKLDQWALPGTPRIIAERFELTLQRLRRLVTPRVVAAVFSTGWNRWCTARRFKNTMGIHNFCQLGCGGQAQDSVEHYSRGR
ncbi:unnamed protein product, partial [Prorocentrum cordatum]